jgi:O-antigen/teichoic acid export membrane protein
MVIKVAAAGLSYVMFAALARWLGPNEYGHYASAFSAGTFLGFAILVGLNSDVLRSLPAATSRGGAASQRAYLDGANRALLVSFGVAALLCLLLTTTAAGLGERQWAMSILLAFGFGGALGIAEYLASIFRAMGSVIIALVPRDVVWRVLLAVAVLAASALGITTGVAPAALLSICLLLLACAWQLVAGRRLLPRHDDDRQPVLRARSVLWGARWLALATLAANLLQPLSVVVVGAVISFSDSGVFFAAQKTAALLSLPLLAMNTIGAPEIARAWADGNAAHVQGICRLVVTVSSVVTLAGFVPMVVSAGPLLAVFNPSYGDSGSVLIILAASNVVNALAGPTGVLMQMTGREKHLIGLIAFGQGAGLVLIGWFGISWGVTGAAWGLFAGTLLWNGIITIWSRRRLQIDPSVLSLARTPRD